MERNELISPFMQGAFSEPVLHKLVLSKIDFELPDNIWDEINVGFEHYWNVKANNAVIRAFMDNFGNNVRFH